MRTSGSSKLLDISGDPINPATEDTLALLLAAIDSLGGTATSLDAGRKVVAVLNTSIAIGLGACKVVFLTALSTNKDLIVWGDTNIIYTEATREGNIMYPGDPKTISIDNLSKIFINGKAGDGVSFTFTN